MDDTQAIKPIATFTLGGTSYSFPRTASAAGDKYDRRQNLTFNGVSVSPVVLRIAHTPFSRGNAVQRTMAVFDSQLARLNGDSIVERVDKLSVKIGLDRDPFVTEDEFIELLKLALGWLIETRSSVDYAAAKQLYNAEK